MNITDIPKVFQDDDTVYHYTKSIDALFYILKDMQLRISPRANSLDPIENTKEFISYSGVTNHELLEVGRRISCELKSAKQLSFCKNNLSDSNNVVPMVEKYGFVKPRMWDNYGDKYKGVCLAFSKKKLKEAIENTELFDNDVEYMRYEDFSIKHHSLEWRNSSEETYEFYLEKFKRRLFYKHLDYKMENEYRICSLSSNNEEHIDIRKALIGLIVSDIGINQRLFDEFEKRLNNTQKGLNYMIISFRNKKPCFQTYDEQNKFMKSIKLDFQQIKSSKY